MTKPIDIIVPRENVNDEFALLVSWLVAHGGRVVRGEPIVQIETSKATLELEAPADGFLQCAVQAGDEVNIGATIGQIIATPAASDCPPPPSPSHAPVTESASNGQTRISIKAKKLIHQLGLDESIFKGRGLIRSRDIEAPDKLVVSTPTAARIPSGPVAATGVSTRVEPLSRAKRTEANYLRSGLESTLASVVTVSCPTRGFREASGGNATAIILFEAARLLAKYPEFNAYHSAGNIHYYDEINIGFAVDLGRNLKVPIIRNADRKGLTAITDEMRDLTVACMNNNLHVESLSGGTFTLSDLSGEGVTFFHPLINRGQSAILGVCAAVLPKHNGWGTFNLILAFDHQLSEGRTAAQFLKDLVKRIECHESSFRRLDELAPLEQSRCSRCTRSHSELTNNRNLLLQAVDADGTTKLLCSLCVNGWS